MTGFEPWTSGVGSDCSTNWATTTTTEMRNESYLNEEWLINDLKTIIFLQILSKLLMHDMIHLMSSNQFVLNVDKKMTHPSKASLVILKSKRPFNCSNYYKFQTCLKMVKLGGNAGLVVIVGDSYCKGHEFQSWHHILDGHFSHLFVVKFVICVWNDTNKLKRGRGWPIFFKKWKFFLLTFAQNHFWKSFILYQKSFPPAVYVIKLFLE